jgi:hypothetical protein
MAKAFGVLTAVAVGLGASAMCLAATKAEAQEPQTATAVASTPAPAAKPAPARSGGYYIEFRSGQIGTYGHSYVVYGRLNARGEPADRHYADRYPVGGYLAMAVGHVMPVPANKEWDPGVLTLPIVSSFRRKLNEAQYRKLVAAVKRARASKQYWNAIANNCNHFIAELAVAIGMNVPAGLQVSYTFIPALRDANQRTP